MTHEDIREMLDEIENVRRLQMHYFSVPRDGGIEKSRALAASINAETLCDVLVRNKRKNLPSGGQYRAIAAQTMNAYETMREAQATYFKGGFKPLDLSAAKKAETALDKALPALKRLLIQIQTI